VPAYVTFAARKSGQDIFRDTQEEPEIEFQRPDMFPDNEFDVLSPGIRPRPNGPTFRGGPHSRDPFRTRYHTMHGPMDDDTIIGINDADMCGIWRRK